MSVFVDTSALVALLNESEVRHERARAWFLDPAVDEIDLVTHNYLVVEAIALIRNRLGSEPARHLMREVLGAVRVDFVDRELHRVAEEAYLASGLGPASFVDWVSFVYMREQGIREAFAFDSDFETQGFTLVA